MASNDKLDIPFDKLALEPMDDKVTAADAPGAPVRFQADRRSGLDRRPTKTWEPGSNL